MVKRGLKVLTVLMVCLMVVSVFAACQSREVKQTDNQQPLQDKEEKQPKEQESKIQEDEEKNPLIQTETDDAVICIDSSGEEVTIPKKPQRAIVVHTSMLDLWYMSGGKAVGRPESKNLINVPEEAKDIEIIGHVTAPNTEKVLSLQPDLVVLRAGMDKHMALKEVLDQSNIPTILLGYENYSDFENILDLFASINNDKNVIENIVPDIKENVSRILNKCPQNNHPKVLVLFASSRSVSCETPEAHVGKMVELLGGKNIVADFPTQGKTRIQFSMEKIIEKDPDIILIATMGSMENIKKRMKEDIESNQAWAGLRAVKEERVHYLPSEFFLYKPNTKYPEAFEYLAKLLYPEVFKP